LINGDEAIKSIPDLEDEYNSKAKKIICVCNLFVICLFPFSCAQDALEVQSEMVRQVTECTSTTISSERARSTSMSIALDHAEEKLEKIGKEYRETKQNLERAEHLQVILKQQLV
jgi:hypothetical protein